MGSLRLRFLLLASIAGVPQMVFGQLRQDEDENEIVVTGERPRGSVAGDIAPELTLNPADVRALGVSNVTELLAELAPQLASGRGDGPPVVLLEGRRISGFREIATLPAEAIARVEILPEETALKFGFPANQKVVNIVLRQRFRAFTLEADGRAATGGGGFNAEGEFDFLRIHRNGRFNINAEYESTDRLLESQRGVISSVGQPEARTLLPARQQFKLNATLNRNFANDLSATLNGELTTDATQALFGQPAAVQSPLERSAGTQTGYAAASVNGMLAKWRWTFTANYTRIDSKTLIDRLSGPTTVAADLARSASDVGIADFTISGTPLKLSAGDVSATAKIGTQFSSFQASSLRAAVATTGGVTRNIGNGQISVDVPLTSRRRGVLSAIGDLSLNANAAAQRLSDYGTLTTIGYGANWSPLKGVSILASYTDDDGAPSPQQIGNPVVAQTGVQFFDFVRGENVTVTQISGGNPALLKSNAKTWKLGVNLKPFAKPDISLQADYVRTRTTNGVAALPPASLASQAAFAGRYIRDAAGVLTSVDARAVNFASADRSQLRWGINFSKPLKTSQSQIDAMRALFRERFPNGPPPGFGQGGGGGQSGGPPGGGRGFGGGGFGGGPGGGGGRLTLAVYHTIHFTDRVTLLSGLPAIDLLNGGVIGTGGGQPRHEIDVQAGVAKNGFGLRVNGNWQSATRVDGATAADDLRFSDLAKVDLRLFANLGQMPSILRSAPWLRGTRVTLGVNNLFDSRQRVTDGTGVTPLAYQPGTLDPLGRTIRISVRKLLF